MKGLWPAKYGHACVITTISLVLQLLLSDSHAFHPEGVYMSAMRRIHGSVARSHSTANIACPNHRFSSASCAVQFRGESTPILLQR